MKKQIKKSLSLFMAVLMVLSCWVWVAPTEAQAAGAEDGQYYFKWVVGEISEAGNSGKWEGNTLQINYKKADGTDGSTTINLDKSKYNSTGTNKVVWEGWIDGFPTWAGWYMKMEYKAFNSVYLNAREATYYVGSSSSNVQAVSNTDSFKWENNAAGGIVGATGAKEGTLGLSTQEDKYPKITSFSGKPSSEVTVKVPAINAELENKKVFTDDFTIKCYDQYGVRITDAKELKGLDYGIKTTNTASLEFDANFTEETYALWYKDNNVWYNRDVQQKLTKVDMKSYYLFVHFTSTRYGDKNELLSTITLDYPEYTVTIDTDGPIDDLNPNVDMSDNTTLTEGSWNSGDLVYSAVPGSFPKGTASKEGYEFFGFWTKPQPADEDENGNPIVDTHYNTPEAKFATPVSTEDFVNVYGGTEDGTIIEVNGKNYYNAGRRWDSTTDKEVLGNANFYAWWNADDITVKFYDIDGAYLGTKTTKTNKTEGSDFYPDPKERYTAGSFEYQTFTKTWRDISGAIVIEGSKYTGEQKEFVLSPIYSTKTFTGKYYISFVNPSNGNDIDGNSKDDAKGSSNYEYRHILEGANIPTVSVPAALSSAAQNPNSLAYTYEFTGWSSLVPADGLNYHVVAKNDTSFVENTDWVVRDSVKYYPVFRTTVKEYVVSFTYTDTTGTTVKETQYVPYGSTIVTPNYVNRTYAKEGKEYTLTGWGYKLNSTNKDDMHMGADDALILNKDNIKITNVNLHDGVDERAIEFTATYNDGVDKPYTVTFKYKNDKGEDKTYTTPVNHGSKITAAAVTELASRVPALYDDGDAQFEFQNKWIITEGTDVLGKSEYENDDFTGFSPTSHVTFEAVYDNGTPFYTVTYHDGNRINSERILQGSNVPAWLEGGEEYIPSRPDAETGEYTFAGWFDEKQADDKFAATNGTKYTLENRVEGDLDLYAQFTFSPFKYLIKFVNYDGTLLGEGEVEAGKSFADIYNAAINADPTKPSDKTYSYSFIGWDFKVPDNLICEGKDITYTAQYKSNYVQYKARWYNDEASMKKADTEMELVGDDGLLAITSYTYGGKVYAPSVSLTIPKGKVFNGWKYINKDGEPVDYVRGMTITSDMSFYADYVLAPESYTITAVVNGVENEYDVAPVDGKNPTAEVVGEPIDGYVDEEFHNSFVGWYTTETCNCEEDNIDCTHEFALKTEVTGDITIYARFEYEAHSEIDKKVLEEATYYATGKKLVGCACSDATNKEVAIPILQDTTAPTGTIYLGGQSWSSKGTPAYETDGDPISIFVNGNSDVVITANDAGIGVRVIRAFAFPAGTVLTAENYGAAQDLAVNVYEDNTQNLTRNANYSVKLKDFRVADLTEDGSVQKNEDGTVKFKKLENGKSYIIYYYVNDKATTANGAPATGNQLKKLVRTAKFTYDTEAPEITVSGDNNAKKDPVVTTYCGQAVIKGIENDATVTVNGKAVTLTTAGANGYTQYVINEAGNYLIKVTDKAGNSATKKIVVAAGHNEVTTSQEVSCVANGYTKVACSVCDKVIKYDVVTSAGHQYSEVTTVAPTCEKGGYDIKTCSVCGDEVKSNETAVVGHTYNTDADGNIIYDIEVAKVTCSTDGKMIANCTVCGKGTQTKVIAHPTKEELAEMSPEKKAQYHKYGAKKTLKATCTAAGEEYQMCKLCFEKVTIKELPALNHENTGRYTKVTTAATCKNPGEENTYCKACDAVIGEGTVIPATGKHIWTVSTDPNETFEATGEMEGQITYKCQTCDETKVETIAKIEKYTVAFYAEDGTTKLFEIPAVVKGATITKDYTWTTTEGEETVTNTIVEPTKDSTNENNYSFNGWVDLDGNAVRFPFELNANLSLKATFKATKRTYTHKFMVDNNTEFKTIVGTYNDTDKKPSAVPTKEDADGKVIYEFKGWLLESGATPENFNMTGDKTFVADFKTTEVKYTVAFVNGTTEIGKIENVAAGSTISTAAYTATRAADKDAHYTFEGWYLDTTFKTKYVAQAIKADTTLYAKFKATKHTFGEDVTVVTPATCTAAGEGKVVCTCGYEKKVTIDKLGHTYGEGVYDEATGEIVKTCSGCGDEIRTKDSFTVSFVNEGSVALYNVTVKSGESAVYALDKNEDGELDVPAKQATNQNEYKFIGWKLQGSTDTTVYEIDHVFENIQAEVIYVAQYKAIARTYPVSYVDYSNKIIESYELAYGAAIPAFGGDMSKIVREADETSHYIFKEWVASKGTLGTVSGETVIRPEFTTVKHDYKPTGETTAPSCTQKGGETARCVCGAETVFEGTVDALGHNWDVENAVITKEPTLAEDGVKTISCTRCDATKTEKISATGTSITIKVTENGSVVANATVELKENGIIVNKGVTDANGEVTFTVAKSDKTYTYTVTTEDGREIVKDEKAKPGKNESKVTTTHSCGCSCHRNNFWGIIFRLFQKFIKLFTGKINCCSCPDAAYN